MYEDYKHNVYGVEIPNIFLSTLSQHCDFVRVNCWTYLYENESFKLQRLWNVIFFYIFGIILNFIAIYLTNTKFSSKEVLQFFVFITFLVKIISLRK